MPDLDQLKVWLQQVLPCLQHQFLNLDAMECKDRSRVLRKVVTPVINALVNDDRLNVLKNIPDLQDNLICLAFNVCRKSLE
jgi:hypothetical protein